MVEDRIERAERLIKIMREDAGLVCDSIFRCAGWERSYEQIIDAQKFVANRGAEYTGDKFKFCPWCAKEIKWEI